MSQALKDQLQTIVQAAIQAVSPDTAVFNHLRRQGDHLFINDQAIDLSRYERIVVAGAGKGAAPMAKAMEDILGDDLDDGVCVVKYGHGLPLSTLRLLEASHPVPDRAGFHAAHEILELVTPLGENDLVFVVLTGGASALLPCPMAPVSFVNQRRLTGQLLACGAEIHQINTIRKHLSGIQGGRLAQAAYPARVVTLIVSDVIGDNLSAIASGPTAPDPTTFADCMNIIDAFKLRPSLPEDVLELLEAGLAQAVAETLKPGDPIFNNVENYILANNRQALAAAANKAQSLGLHPLVLTSTLNGEASQVAKFLASVGLEAASTGRPTAGPACILAGGETTVTIRGKGKGGRNQEMALAFALELDKAASEGLPSQNLAFLSAGTDGTDGPTDAAGAFATAETVSRGNVLGLNATQFLDHNDSYNYFKQLDDLLITGPTKTNVMDIAALIVK
ncbi:glycerate kinase type-2 family protein [Desulfovibrio inopinatus]|uniref:glycerate kinase type-2 family protein n=1 Tax=Desulfovibrio inopinatus TaxID=102109 RepID=UPI000424A3ED|nr:glycerate kinase [Desulfovibrio inopinatus]